MTKKYKKAIEKWKDYLLKYEDFLKEVREETFKIFSKKGIAIMESIYDSIEFYPRGRIEQETTIHSFSGILRNYFWKLTNWISYEILHGKYFEAMRDIRFLFEGSIWSVIMEDAIEKVIYEKFKIVPSHISLKLDIIDLWKRVKTLKPKKRTQKNIQKIIQEYFQELHKKKRLKKISPTERREYINTYLKILQDKRLFLGIPSLIDKTVEEFNENFSIRISQKINKKLKNTWRALCEYTHFPGIFFHEITEDVPFVFVEKLNKRMFQECFKNYLATLDLFYSVNLWRWPINNTIKRIENCVRLWEKDLKIRFELTYKILNSKKFK